MSIATLKKKTASRYNNLSVGKVQFSLNGSHRSQGFVGQTMLSRSLPRTLMTGNTVRGHGGQHGQYVRGAIVREGTGLGAASKLNNPNVVKSSVLDTNGMLKSKYRWIRRPAPYTSVKPDSTLNVNTQGQYIDTIQRVVLSSMKYDNPIIGKAKNCDCNGIMRPSYTDHDWMSRKRVITKPDVVTTQGDYVTQLDMACATIDSCAALRSLMTKKNQSTPFACGNPKFTPIQQLKVTGVGASTIVYIP